ncbi:hypothetical protein DA2_2626 [Desulfovibrio sp. A2]|nr:hypothetical protein DA2_2626 [Desulfovibrio sp. A2]GBO97226.1 hypothetical protein RVX_2265 [Nitratidesulfovibrio sp. HK-II]
MRVALKAWVVGHADSLLDRLCRRGVAFVPARERNACPPE